MNHAEPRRRFRSVLTREGTITVPESAREGLGAGAHVTVEIVSSDRDRHDEDEVAAIAARQAEHPDTVRKCLAAQGALAGRREGPRSKARAATARTKRAAGTTRR